jgi:hypothetical protein
MIFYIKIYIKFNKITNNIALNEFSQARTQLISLTSRAELAHYLISNEKLWFEIDS